MRIQLTITPEFVWKVGKAYRMARVSVHCSTSLSWPHSVVFVLCSLLLLHPQNKTQRHFALQTHPQQPHDTQDRLHGGSLRWWLWVEDPVLNRLHHAEGWTLTKKVRWWWCCGIEMALEGPQKLGFT